MRDPGMRLNENYLPPKYLYGTVYGFGFDGADPAAGLVLSGVLPA
jgi:hypothetical protein